MKQLGCITAWTLTLIIASPVFSNAGITIDCNDNQTEKTAVTTIVLSKPGLGNLKLDSNLEPGIHLRGLCLPGKIEKFYEALRPLYENQEVNQEMLENLKRAIVKYYQDNDRPVVLVKILPQRIENGVLHISVVEATIDQITFSGNCWFSDEQLRSYLDFETGDPIYRDILTKDLELMNRNPFRRTDVVFSPGSRPLTTNLEFITDEQIPVRVYTGGDNTGYRATDYNRWYTGINIGNLGFADNLLDYQYMTGPNANDFFSHTLKYSAPLPWRHYLVIYGGYSKVHIKESPLKTTGKTGQVSGRYEIPISPHTELLQEVTIGFDYKFTQNNLFQSEGNAATLFNGIVNLTELMVGYNLGWERSFYKSSFTVEGFYSPCGIISHESHSDYTNMRRYATPKFFYGRVAFAPIFRLPHRWAAHITMRGQISTATLIQSEQFSVGGYDTVRGYLEREVAGDNAFVGNLELRTPPIKILQWFSKRMAEDSFLLLGFLDYGYIHNLHHVALEKQNANLLGIGPGARYNLGSYISARVDWGFQLVKTDINPLFSNRVHFALVMAY